MPMTTTHDSTPAARRAGPRFGDIRGFITASNTTDVPWKDLEDWVARMQQEEALDLDPSYQRGHVWTRDQQIAFVEFTLRGGTSARVLRFNHPGWDSGTASGRFELVDGKQRLTAALAFLRNEIPAFGHDRREYVDHLRVSVRFEMHINSLQSDREVLQWYLELNAGGVVHTPEELATAARLLAEEAGPEALEGLPLHIRRAAGLDGDA